jgi:hypothetical protein
MIEISVYMIPRDCGVISHHNKLTLAVHVSIINKLPITVMTAKMS